MRQYKIIKREAKKKIWKSLKPFIERLLNFPREKTGLSGDFIYRYINQYDVGSLLAMVQLMLREIFIVFIS